MLGNHPIAPVLLATDLAAARDFYHGKLGLQIERENEHAIVFRCGRGQQGVVTARLRLCNPFGRFGRPG